MNLHGTKQKAFIKIQRTKRLITKRKMDEEQEEDEGMTITFLKNKHFHIPSILSD